MRRTVDASSGQILAAARTPGRQRHRQSDLESIPCLPAHVPAQCVSVGLPEHGIRASSGAGRPFSGCDRTVGQSGEPGRSLDALGPRILRARRRSTTTEGTTRTIASSGSPRPTTRREPQGRSSSPRAQRGDYAYPWTNAWFASKCDPANLVDQTTGQPRAGTGNDISGCGLRTSSRCTTGCTTGRTASASPRRSGTGSSTNSEGRARRQRSG